MIFSLLNNLRMANFNREFLTTLDLSLHLLKEAEMASFSESNEQWSSGMRWATLVTLNNFATSLHEWSELRDLGLV